MKKMLFGYLEERFGIPGSVFAGHEFYSASKGRVYLGPKKTISSPEPVSVGMLAARIGRAVKPSTNLLQLFGRHATKNIIKLDRKNTLKYVNGEDIEVETDATDGYVLLTYKNSSIGCGFLKGKKVGNLLPKAKRARLKFL